jgi:hypothetical protein
VSDINGVLNDGGDAADILVPPTNMIAWIASRRASETRRRNQSRAAHPSNPKPALEEYDLNEILGDIS